jgi:hypothetical protein
MNKFLNWINQMFSSNNSNYWIELERAWFLLKNLQDDDLNWGPVYAQIKHLERYFTDYSIQNKSNELYSVLAFYISWNAIAIQISELNDYELNPWWSYKFDASIQHLNERVFPMLSITNQNIFLNTIPVIHKRMNQNKLIRLDEILYE